MDRRDTETNSQGSDLPVPEALINQQDNTSYLAALQRSRVRSSSDISLDINNISDARNQGDQINSINNPDMVINPNYENRQIAYNGQNINEDNSLSHIDIATVTENSSSIDQGNNKRDSEKSSSYFKIDSNEKKSQQPINDGAVKDYFDGISSGIDSSPEELKKPGIFIDLLQKKKTDDIIKIFPLIKKLMDKYIKASQSENYELTDNQTNEMIIQILKINEDNNDIYHKIEADDFLSANKHENKNDEKDYFNINELGSNLTKEILKNEMMLYIIVEILNHEDNNIIRLKFRKYANETEIKSQIIEKIKLEESKKKENGQNNKEVNEITLSLLVTRSNVSKEVFFLDWLDNNNQLNKDNIEVYINGCKVEFTKFFIPKEEGFYIIELIFKNNITDCSDMFYGCSNIFAINLSKFNAWRVFDMCQMFKECRILYYLYLSSLNTENVINMRSMFAYCEKLSTIDLSSFNTENVQNMSNMFYNCKELTNIDLSSFNIKNTIDTSCMFYGCENLVNILIDSTYFNTGKIYDMSMMFFNCKKLTNIDLSSFITEKVVSMGSMFEGCSSLKKLNLKSFKTEKVNTMESMFDNCCSLTELNLSSFNTKEVTNLNRMFYKFSLLTALDLSSFDTHKVSNIGNLFGECSSLTSLNLSSFNTENISNMNSMLYNCSSLKSINLSSFNTHNVFNMKYMFCGCSSLTTFDLSMFITKNVLSMEGMFKECSSLKSINLSSFNTHKVFNMKYMFDGCSSLIILNLSSFHVHANTFKMFSRCNKLLFCFSFDKKIIYTLENKEGIELDAEQENVVPIGILKIEFLHEKKN